MPRARQASLYFFAGIGLAVALGVLSTPAIARACQCAQPRPEVGPALTSADLVLEARVESHAFVREVGFRTRLKVAKTHKGAHRGRLVLTAAKTCAVPFEVGTRYLVYAYADGDGGFTTTYCSRTMPLHEAARDLEVIARVTNAEGASSPAQISSPSLPEGWTDADFVRVVAFLSIFRR